MLNLERILGDDRLMRATTGLTRKAFEALLPSFTAAYQQSVMQPERRRQRAIGGGRKATLRTPADKLYFILLYCKCYPTMDLLGILFNFDRSCACDWIHSLLPVVEQALGEKQVLPERKIRSFNELMERFPGVKAVIIDGTERPVERPQDKEKQKAHYSAKKKRHTRKHITGSTRDKRVILLTKARPGTVHDKRQLAEEGIIENIPDRVRIEGDLGFKGLENEFNNVHLPHKRKPGKGLTKQQKRYNRAFSRKRVKCEHAHAGIKRYNSVSAIYRNHVPDFDDKLMLVATGLWNWYLEAA